jgi:hypothetical protein
MKKGKWKFTGPRDENGNFNKELEGKSPFNPKSFVLAYEGALDPETVLIYGEVYEFDEDLVTNTKRTLGDRLKSDGNWEKVETKTRRSTTTKPTDAKTEGGD